MSSMANEGHTAFMLLERTRELVQTGLGFEESRRADSRDEAFSRHTPRCRQVTMRFRST